MENMSSTGAVATFAPPFGGAILSYYLVEVFGPNITVAGAIAAFVGCAYFYATHIGKSYLHNNALIAILVFVCSWFGALYLTSFTLDILVDALQARPRRAWSVPIAFLWGFGARLILGFAEKAVASFSFNRFGITIGDPQRVRGQLRGYSDRDDSEDGPSGPDGPPVRPHRHYRRDNDQ